METRIHIQSGSLHPFLLLLSLMTPIQVSPHPSPILQKSMTEDDYNDYDDFNSSPFACFLPKEQDLDGTETFLEDCNSLHRIDKLPVPGRIKIGTHPIVCCPKYVPTTAICFSSDPWCPTFEGFDFGDELVESSYDYDGGDYGDSTDYVSEDSAPSYNPTMSDRSCNPDHVPNVVLVPGYEQSGGASCVTLDRCPDTVDDELAPTENILPCGFDRSAKLMMVCCPDKKVRSQRQNTTQTPRFPDNRGRAEECLDQTPYCQLWKNNGGCKLDENFVLAPDPFNIEVNSKDMFELMQTACPKTCSLCGDKGCVDDHALCPVWAKKGMCSSAAFFMGHTCRESCGVCGFLSVSNTEEQVVDGKSYTDFTKSNFDCGRFNKLDRSEEEDQSSPLTVEVTTPKPTVPVGQLVDIREDDSDDLFFSFGTEDPDTYRCGSTVISDKWILSAAHCWDKFENDRGKGLIDIQTYRDETENIETIEIKRVYKHPQYNHPQLYNDVALLQLGRRIEFDFDKYGDTPTCLDNGLDKEAIGLATVQGYGLTEDGTRGGLLETNVTVISNTKCKDIIEANITNNLITKRKFTKGLPYGLDLGLMCSAGIYNEDIKEYSGACEGDSGGPLTQVDGGRSTLVGLVSGGLGCGKGFPNWYTDINYYRDWYLCIIEQTSQRRQREEIERICNSAPYVKENPKCADIVEKTSLFKLVDLGFNSDEVCEGF